MWQLTHELPGESGRCRVCAGSRGSGIKGRAGADGTLRRAISGTKNRIVGRSQRRVTAQTMSMERPTRSDRMGLSSLGERSGLTLHELHEFVLGIIHHLGRDGDDASFLGEPFNFLARHRTNEIGDVVKALLRFRGPCHAVGTVIL